jgi:hypothetical protein
MASPALIEAVAVTAELCGRTFSEGAARVFIADLDGFPEPAVLVALRRCRREVRGILTVQDVVSRIDDGRPGVEEAWAMLPKDEASSCVWTDEMREAFAVALPLLVDGDSIAARMAFKETYTRLLATARDERRAPNWTASLGHDAGAREVAIRDAADRGRLSHDQAAALLPAPTSQPPCLLTNETPANGAAKAEAMNSLKRLAQSMKAAT